MTRTQEDVFASNLRAALASSDMTQEALARIVGVSLRAVQKWCGGTAEPKGRQLVRVAEALKREPSWFYAEPEAAAA